MILRPVTYNELPELASLDARANRSPWSLFSYQQSASQPQHQIIGAYNEQDKLLGACVFSQVLDEGEILQLCIRYEKQRNGYAYQLLEHVCRDLREQQVNQIFLEVMLGNLAAINLYHKIGFNVISTRKNYYKVDGKYIDALVMAKQL